MGIYDIGIGLDVGRKRKSNLNQDAVKVLLPNIFNRRPPLLLLADGMGGYKGGAIASSLVITAILNSYKKARVNLPPQQKLEQGIIAAHQAVKRKAKKISQLSSMGSTVVGAILNTDVIYLANVGDSRAYIFRHEEIIQLSLDHSVVGELVRQGLLTQEQARRHPDRNRLTMSITAQREEIKPYLTTFEWCPEDVLVLCSDGLWGVIPEVIIQAVVLEMSPQQAVKKLVDLANASQGPDNISVIIACRKSRNQRIPEKLAMSPSDETNPGFS